MANQNAPPHLRSSYWVADAATRHRLDCIEPYLKRTILNVATTSYCYFHSPYGDHVKYAYRVYSISRIFTASSAVFLPTTSSRAEVTLNCDWKDYS